MRCGLVTRQRGSEAERFGLRKKARRLGQNSQADKKF
jgi:hypothetical protein